MRELNKTYKNIFPARKAARQGLKKDSYDTIIIGAGIGGLACGCYLAKAGMKVLIVEKNPYAGGYCASFSNRDFTFDTCVHTFSGCGSGEVMDKIRRDLKLDVTIVRADPSDVVVMPEGKIVIKNRLDETVGEFKKNFPRETKIDAFFSLFDKDRRVRLYNSLRKNSFSDLLDEYFSDERIKAVLSVFLGNIGIPPSRASAFTAVLFLNAFILNGGYYPLGGMGKLAEAFSSRFLELGGDLVLGSEVSAIKISGRETKGVLIKNEYIPSRFVVSGADARHTFLNLIGRGNLSEKFVSGLESLLASNSAFVVYLGLKEIEDNEYSRCMGIWKMPADYNVEKSLSMPLEDKISEDDFVFCSIPSSLDKTVARNNYQTMRLIVNAPFKDVSYWRKNKAVYAESLISRARQLFPRLESNILFKGAATPQTFFHTTRNYRGSMCGWLNTNAQNESDLFDKHGIEKLYLAGHWLPVAYGQGGIAMVAYSGKKIARAIKSQFKR
ncbi:MAG: NAD(P)/FAD-dependent oxidoreductase [Candidatus Omnitrophota bacterium]